MTNGNMYMTILEPQHVVYGGEYNMPMMKSEIFEWLMNNTPEFSTTRDHIGVFLTFRYEKDAVLAKLKWGWSYD